MKKAISIALLLMLVLLPAAIAETEEYKEYAPSGGFEGYIRHWISIPGTVIFKDPAMFSVRESRKLVTDETTKADLLSHKQSGINSVRDYRYVILRNDIREVMDNSKPTPEYRCIIGNKYEHLYNPCLQMPSKTIPAKARATASSDVTVNIADATTQ